MKKAFLSIGLACLVLNLESTALRQAARFGLVARAGVLRAAQPVQRVLPAASQAVRSVSTTSQSSASSVSSKKKMLGLGSLVGLGVAGGAVIYSTSGSSTEDQFRSEQEVLDYIAQLPESERASYAKNYLEKAYKVGKILDIFEYPTYVYGYDSVNSTEKFYLYDYLLPEEQKNLSLRVLQKHITDPKIMTLLGDVQFFTSHFSQEEKEECYARVFLSFVDNVDWPVAIACSDPLYKIFTFLKRAEGVLSAEKRSKLSIRVIQKILSTKLKFGDFNRGNDSALASLFQMVQDRDTQSQLALLFLEKFKNSSSITYFPYLSSYISQADRMKWINFFVERLLKNEIDERSFYVSVLCLDDLPAEFAEKASKQLFLYASKSGREIDPYYLVKAIKFLSDPVEQNKALIEHTALRLYLSEDPALLNIPLFGAFNLTYFEAIYKNFRNFDFYSPSFTNDAFNFKNLLPLIAEFTAEQAKQDKIVLYHGQSSEWIFVTHIYELLRKVKTGIDLPEDFIPFRFVESCPFGGLSNIRDCGLPGYDLSSVREWLLFCNLHPCANKDTGSNSLSYVFNNQDQSTISGRLNVFDKVESLFKEQGFQKEWELYKDEVFDLKTLHDEAIKDQGNYGRMICISMDKKFARENAYVARPGGTICRFLINGKETSDPVDLAEHFDQAPFDNEIVLCLTDDMLDPEKARGKVKMKAFDPAIYWETEKAQKYNVALKDLMARIQASYEARTK